MSANVYLPPVITIPGKLVISAVSRTYPARVTIVDSSQNTYMIGMCVYFTVPAAYRMVQLNGLTGQIINIIGLDFYVDIDATNFDTFSAPISVSPPYPEQPATISSAGSKNLEYNNFTRRVAFQSLNNVGN